MSISPISLIIDLRSWNSINNALPPAIFFRMSDGTIKTENQLLKNSYNSGSVMPEDNNEKGDIFRLHYRFEKILSLNEIQSIILENTEYPFNKNIEPKKITIDKNLKRFETKIIEKTKEDGPLRISVDDICEKLGAKYNWDIKNNNLELTYRGTTLEIKTNSNIVIVDGKEISLDEYDSLNFSNGELSITSELLHDYFDIGFFLMSDQNNPSDNKWIVTP